MKHFKLTSETKVCFGITLYRIEATQDIPRLGIMAGDKGGWVEKETNVSGNAWVSGNAQVSGDAQVSGNAQVDSSSAILLFTFATFYTVTVCRKHVFVGCKSWSRSEARKLTLEQAKHDGCPEKYYKPLKQMMLWGMRLVKEEAEK
jgi:hypothetical protein